MVRVFDMESCVVTSNSSWSVWRGCLCRFLGLNGGTNQKHQSHHSLPNPVLAAGSLKFNAGILKECIHANILRYEL